MGMRGGQVEEGTWSKCGRGNTHGCIRNTQQKALQINKNRAIKKKPKKTTNKPIPSLVMEQSKGENEEKNMRAG